MIPTLGAVFFDEDFTFHDGDSSPKLFVVLGSKDGVSVVVKTTSNGRLHKNDYGCQAAERFPAFFLPHGRCFLNKNTWVCLDEYYEFSGSQLLRNMVVSKIRRMGELDAGLIKEVMLCAIDCDDISAFQEGVIQHSIC